MKRIFISLVLFCAVGVYAAVPQKETVSTNAAAAQPVVEIDYAAKAISLLESGDIAGAEKLLPEIKAPAGKLYVQACVERAKGTPKVAIRTIAKGIARHYHDQAWIAKSELLIAELYIECNMLNEADAAARQVQALYTETDVVKKADALRSKIEKLKETVKE